MRTKRFLMSVLMTLVMCTASWAQGLIGTWEADSAFFNVSINGVKGNVTLNFNEDKTFAMNFHIVSPIKENGLNFVLIADIIFPGTYNIESDSIINTRLLEDSVDLKIDLDFPDFDKEQSTQLKNMMLSQMMPDDKKALLNQILGEQLLDTMTGRIGYNITGETLRLGDSKIVLKRIKKQPQK